MNHTTTGIVDEENRYVLEVVERDTDGPDEEDVVVCSGTIPVADLIAFCAGLSQPKHEVLMVAIDGLRKQLSKRIDARYVIRALAELQELKLRKHDADRGDRGWLYSDLRYLLDRLDDEVIELRAECNRFIDHPPCWEQVKAVEEEAADVANFAAMIADWVRNRGIR